MSTILPLHTLWVDFFYFFLHFHQKSSEGLFIFIKKYEKYFFQIFRSLGLIHGGHDFWVQIFFRNMGFQGFKRPPVYI
jgi:hypothetical protein